MNRKVLALDIASVTGWCFGEQGGKPHYGTIRFAPPGASNAEIASGAIKWLVDFIKVSQPNTIIYEATNAQHMAGRTTIKTIRILCGLPFLMEGVALRMGIHDVREATTSEVRHYFIGCNPKRDVAKGLVMKRCNEMGYSPDNDNEGDAISLWHFQCALLEMK